MHTFCIQLMIDIEGILRVMQEENEMSRMKTEVKVRQLLGVYPFSRKTCPAK